MFRLDEHRMYEVAFIVPPTGRYIDVRVRFVDSVVSSEIIIYSKV